MNNDCFQDSRMPQQTTPDTFCAQRLKLLADSTRLGVMELLLDGPKRVNELNAVLGVDQSLLSHHLQVLRKELLVESVRDGKGVLYRLAPGVETPGTSRAINLSCCLLSFTRPARHTP